MPTTTHAPAPAPARPLGTVFTRSTGTVHALRSTDATRTVCGRDASTMGTVPADAWTRVAITGPACARCGYPVAAAPAAGTSVAPAADDAAPVDPPNGCDVDGSPVWTLDGMPAAYTLTPHPARPGHAYPRNADPSRDNGACVSTSHALRSDAYACAADASWTRCRDDYAAAITAGALTTDRADAVIPGDVLRTDDDDAASAFIVDAVSLPVRGITNMVTVSGHYARSGRPVWMPHRPADMVTVWATLDAAPVWTGDDAVPMIAPRPPGPPSVRAYGPTLRTHYRPAVPSRMR